ncbi:MAG: hypothetical protein AAF662_09570 [Pseudomonadota bacterium]
MSAGSSQHNEREGRSRSIKKRVGTTPANEELASWIASLELPFSGIRDAKSRIRVLEARRTELGREAEKLLGDFRDRFPRGTSPAYLCKDTDKTLTPLRWRVSSTAGKSDARKRFELESEVGQRVLSALPHGALRIFLNTEVRRIHLNQAIVTTMYELERLRGFVGHYDAWRRARNTLLS